MYQSSSGLLTVLRRHPLGSFYLLAYALTTLLWLPAVLMHLGRQYEIPGALIGVTGTAIFMTAVTEGKQGVRNLLSRFLMWRIGLTWYAVAICGIAVVAVITGSLVPGGQDSLGALTPSALALYPGAWLYRFYFGPLWEEAGWRGFALGRLQHLHGPLGGTLILGVLWGLWHAPIYLPGDIMEGGVTGGLVSFGVFVVAAIGLAVIFTWVFNNTRGSLLIAFLLHASIDALPTYIANLADAGLISAGTGSVMLSSIPIDCLVVAAVLILVTRGRLSYDRYRAEVLYQRDHLKPVAA